jgi:hypothetical protein
MRVMLAELVSRMLFAGRSSPRSRKHKSYCAPPIRVIAFLRSIKIMKSLLNIKSLGLAVAALACSIGVAAARMPQTPPIGPDVLSKLIPHQAKNGSATTNAASSNITLRGGGASTEVPGDAPAGWNYFHATYCEWYTDGSNDFTFVFPEEGGYWVVENDIYATNTFNTACTNGNLAAVYVTDSSTGSFDRIWTYPYK